MAILVRALQPIEDLEKPFVPQIAMTSRKVHLGDFQRQLESSCTADAKSSLSVNTVSAERELNEGRGRVRNGLDYRRVDQWALWSSVMISIKKAGWK